MYKKAALWTGSILVWLMAPFVGFFSLLLSSKEGHGGIMISMLLLWGISAIFLLWHHEGKIAKLCHLVGCVAFFMLPFLVLMNFGT